MSQQQAGLSLIESIVYITLLAIMSAALMRFTAQLISRNTHVQLTSQVLANARGAMAVLTHEVRHAQGVYDPTSGFAAHPGQLSLETTEQLPAGETETYVDFYVDDDRLYVKREGQDAALITSEQVAVSNFIVTYLHQTSAVPAVRIELTVQPRGSSDPSSAVSLSSTASLRSY